MSHALKVNDLTWLHDPVNMLAIKDILLGKLIMPLIDLSRTIEHRTPAHPSHPPVIMTVE